MKALRKRNRSDSKDSQSQKEELQKNEIPNFLLKLYQILETNEFHNIIEWGDTGRYFIVKNMNEFTDKVLPRFFKHNNYSSFVRQLNMYDFHKLRNSNNENIFQHKHFIRGQKALIKTIKRKSNTHRDSNIENQDTENEEINLVDICERELNSKKISKSAIEKVMSNIIKILNTTNEKQKQLEMKVEMLGKQNEEFIMQNEQMMQELHNKNDYTKKLETLLFFILEVILPKYTPYKNDTKNAIFSTNTINGLIPSSNTEFKTKTSNESTLNAINRGNIMKTTLDGGFLKEIMEKYLDHHSVSKRDKFDLPMLTSSNDDYKTFNKLYPLANSHDIPTAIATPHINNEYMNYNIDNNPNKNLPIANKSNSFNQINLKNQQIKQENSTEDKLNIFYSPNPFAMDDINFTHSNIFSSPRCNRNDNYLSFRNMPEEENKNNENNLITMNTFNLSRNNSMDLNEFYKNGTAMDDEINKKPLEQNFAFDDSYFSVSSDKNKN